MQSRYKCILCPVVLCLEMEAIAIKMPELYSPVMRIWISMIPFFLVYEPKHLQIVLGSNKYSTKNMLYSLLHNFIGDGLITNTGENKEKEKGLNQDIFFRRKMEITSKTNSAVFSYQCSKSLFRCFL